MCGIAWKCVELCKKWVCVGGCMCAWMDVRKCVQMCGIMWKYVKMCGIVWKCVVRGWMCENVCKCAELCGTI